MHEPDFSGIDPLRRVEVRRRIEILNRYLSIHKPTRTDADAHAREIGISTPQFYRLAKAWRIHRRPEVVGAGKRGGRRTRKDGVPNGSRRVVDEVIDDLGSDASLEDLLREVRRRCDAAGTPAPSRGALWTYVMDVRATSPIRSEEPHRIVVGRIWAKLPTLHDGTVLFPEITLAMLLPERTIIGIDLSTDTHRRASAALALARAFASMAEIPPGIKVEIDGHDLEEVRAVHLARLGYDPTPSATSAGRTIAQNLGRVVGGMQILHRPHSAKPGRLLTARAVNPLDEPALAAEVERAVRAHNAALGAGGNDSVRA